MHNYRYNLYDTEIEENNDNDSDNEEEDGFYSNDDNNKYKLTKNINDIEVSNIDVTEKEKWLLTYYGNDYAYLPFFNDKNNNKDDITILQAITESKKYLDSKKGNKNGKWNCEKVENFMKGFIYQNKIAAYLTKTFHLDKMTDLMRKYEELKDSKLWDHNKEYKEYDHVIFDMTYYIAFLQLLERDKKIFETTQKQKGKKKLTLYVDLLDHDNYKVPNYIIEQEYTKEVQEAIDKILKIFPYPLELLQKFNKIFDIKKTRNKKKKIILQDTNKKTQIENNDINTISTINIDQLPKKLKKRKRDTANEIKIEQIKFFMQTEKTKIFLKCNDFRMELDEIYDRYIEYCHDNKINPLKRNIFFVYVKKIYEYNIVDRKRHYGHQKKWIQFDPLKLL